MVYDGLDDQRVDLSAFMVDSVVMTIGRNNDPAELEPVPTNAVVERFVPQAMLLPHVSAT